MTGRLLGNRYELLEKIGGGGMALVYRANDVLLARKVAVKILRPQFAGDEDFVRRFRREAQAAASLSHHHIVAIYDVGHTDDEHFIVMEYVDGITLKEKIVREGPLPVAEALRIAIGIAEALEHAHQNHIVHRDIKPHNVLLGKNGTLKVTDFGIARAVTESTVRHTGTIIGSAHYFSPEQARGGITGERSDLYSLGVVLYEMLTGRVPFEGDSPISIAIKHIHDEVRPVREIVPRVPARVERLVMKAMSKDPRCRFGSAGEMLDELRACLGESQNHRWTGLEEEDPGGDTIVAKAPRPKRRWIPVLGWTVAFLLMAGIGYYGTTAFSRWLDVPTVEVPPVKGMSLAEAQEILDGVKLVPYVIGDRYDPDVPVNHVLSQDPEPGETVRQGRRIKLVVSRGPEMVQGGVPPVETLHVREALIRLEASGLTAKLSEGFSDQVPEDYVIRQNPRAGTMVPKGSEVLLEVSRGPEPTPVLLPDFTGEPLDKVKRRLAELELEAGQVNDEESEMPEGTVIRQDPPATTRVERGSQVNLWVSKGGLRPRSARVRITVPEHGAQVKSVKIVLTDQKGTRTIHEAPHPAGETFEWPIRWVGSQAMVRVYFDGQLGGEEVLR